MSALGVRRAKAALLVGAANPARQSLQPVTKWLGPSIRVSRIDSASVQANAQVDPTIPSGKTDTSG